MCWGILAAAIVLTATSLFLARLTMGAMQVEGQGAFKGNTQALQAMLSGQGLALNADGWHVSLDSGMFREHHRTQVLFDCSFPL